jgi:hypothetical protein
VQINVARPLLARVLVPVVAVPASLKVTAVPWTRVIVPAEVLTTLTMSPEANTLALKVIVADKKDATMVLPASVGKAI